MTQDEIDELVDILSHNQTAGDEVQGAGGCRNARVAGRGKGKSGGYRAVTEAVSRQSTRARIVLARAGFLAAQKAIHRGLRDGLRGVDEPFRELDTSSGAQSGLNPAREHFKLRPLVERHLRGLCS